MNIQLDFGCGFDDTCQELLDNVNMSYCFDIVECEMPDDKNYKFIKHDLTKPLPKTIIDEIKSHNVVNIFLSRSVREILYLDDNILNDETQFNQYVDNLRNLSNTITKLSNNNTIITIFDDLYYSHFLIEMLYINGFEIIQTSLVNTYIIHGENTFGDFLIRLKQKVI